MTTQRQTRGGRKAWNDQFLGAPRQLTIDTESSDLRIHDGLTPGGVEGKGLMARASDAAFANVGMKFYAARNAARDGIVPDNVPIFRADGYANLGDAPPAYYKQVPLNGALLPGQFASNGGTKRWEIITPGNVIDIRNFGGCLPTTSASTNLAALKFCLDYLAARGGGTLLFPATPVGMTAYIFNSDNDRVGEVTDNITIRGAGRGVTRLKITPGQTANFFNLTNRSNVSIFDLSIDCSSDFSGGGTHGIRGVGVNGLTIERVEIGWTARYGIGLQDGTIQNVKIMDNYVHDTGGDGMDIKNRGVGNENIIISGNLFERWGSRPTLESAQAGIDTRGPCIITNNVCRDFSGDRVGIRSRYGEDNETPESPIGGHFSVISNNRIYTETMDATIGIYIGGKDVRCIGNSVQGAGQGIRTIGERSIVNGNTCHGCKNGIHLDDSSTLNYYAHDSIAAANIVYGSGMTQGTGIIVETDRCVVEANNVSNCAIGVKIDSAAENTICNNNSLLGNGASVNDIGVLTHARNNLGWRTSANILAPILHDLKEVGTKGENIAHGLDVTPAIADIQVTPRFNTAAPNPTFVMSVPPYVGNSPDAATINIRSVVSVAEGSEAGNMRYLIRVDARP